jgi:hypothetical protein
MCLVLAWVLPANAGVYDFPAGSSLCNALRILASDGLEAFEDANAKNLVTTVHALVEQQDVPVEERLQQSLPVMKQIVQFADHRFADSSRDVERRLVNQVRNSHKFIRGDTSAHDPTPANWKFFENPCGVTLGGDVRLDFAAAYAKHCEDATSPECARAYRDAVDALSVVVMVEEVLSFLVRDRVMQEVHQLATTRLKQWDIYFNKSIPQWPWELALVNGPLYSRAIRDDQGLAEPPTWQMIVLHPDVAVEYVDGADDGSQFEAVALIEVLGANFWSWEDGKQKGPWGLPVPIGLGAVATFADRGDAEDIGYGGVLHIYHVYNLGVTVRDEDLGFFVSMNLAKLFEDKKTKAQEYLDRVGL